MTVLFAMTTPVSIPVDEKPAKERIPAAGKTAVLPQPPAKPEPVQPVTSAKSKASRSAPPAKAKPAPVEEEPVADVVEKPVAPAETCCRRLRKDGGKQALSGQAGRDAVRRAHPRSLRKNARDNLQRRESRPANLPPPPHRHPALRQNNLGALIVRLQNKNFRG